MNRFETWFCGSSFWRYVTRRQLLPWILQGSELGEHVLELGAGLGAATEELRSRATRVTSLEYDHAFAAKLGACGGGASVTVIQGDASTLPFSDGTFSSAIAILMLHHLCSGELQDRAFAEIFGVREIDDGGIFEGDRRFPSWRLSNPGAPLARNVTASQARRVDGARMRA